MNTQQKTKLKSCDCHVTELFISYMCLDIEWQTFISRKKSTHSSVSLHASVQWTWQCAVCRVSKEVCNFVCHTIIWSSVYVNIPFLAPPMNFRSWKVPKDHKLWDDNDNRKLAVYPPSKLSMQRMWAETLYISRPLAHCILRD